MVGTGRRLLLGWLAAAALLLGLAPAAWAHATLVSSTPADGAVLDTAPAELTFTFDETVQPGATPTEVFDPAGLALAVTSYAEGPVLTVRLPDTLAEGSYVVYWRIISASDDHPIAGISTFSIGRASAIGDLPALQQAPPRSTQVALAVLSGLGYLGLLVAAGMAVFSAWIGPGLTPTRWSDAAAALAVGAALLLVPVAGAYQQQRPLGDVLGGAGWEVALVRDRLLVLGLVAAGLLGARLAHGRRVAVTLAALVAVGAPALVGHSRAAGPSFVVLAADVAHLAAAAVWLGGLVALLVAWRSLDVATLRRFSRWASAATLVLALEGLLLGWRILGSWSALVELRYGRLLLLKLGLVALALLVAAWHRRRHAPAPGLRRAVLAEVVLLVGVVGVVGVAVDQPPVPTAAASLPADSPPPAQEVRLGADTATLTLDPGARGPNRLLLTLTRPDGSPAPGPAPRVTLAHPSYDLGEIPQTRVGPGRWDTLVLLPVHGSWTVTLTRGAESASLRIPVAPAG